MSNQTGLCGRPRSIRTENSIVSVEEEVVNSELEVIREQMVIRNRNFINIAIEKSSF
jgi:hypothetical protein